MAILQLNKENIRNYVFSSSFYYYYYCYRDILFSYFCIFLLYNFIIALIINYVSSNEVFSALFLLYCYYSETLKLSSKRTELVRLNQMFLWVRFERNEFIKKFKYWKSSDSAAYKTYSLFFQWVIINIGPKMCIM